MAYGITYTALDEYVGRADANYIPYVYDANDTTKKYKGTGYTAYVVKMYSQVWRSSSEVDHTLWEHWMVIYKPDTPLHNKALFWIDGGSYNSAAPNLNTLGSDDELRKIGDVAANTGSVVAVLLDVPNESLNFTDEDPPAHPRTEDEIIAYSFQKYMTTGDPNWPALLPMVKSAVRGMDTVQRFCSEKLYWPVEKFLVAGASKRGWTTWLTGAYELGANPSNPRVMGIAPVVIDLLNLPNQMDHHFASYYGVNTDTVFLDRDPNHHYMEVSYDVPGTDDHYMDANRVYSDPNDGYYDGGAFSIAVGSYVTTYVMQNLHSAGAPDLLKIVDPYQYRDRFTKTPKFILNASGDQFFIPDSSQFYYKDLPGESRLRYMPNSGHGINDFESALGSLMMFYTSLLIGLPRPQYSWTTYDVDPVDANYASMHVRTNKIPNSVYLWQATNTQVHDFRYDPNDPNKVYTATALSPTPEGVYIGKVLRPSAGRYTAFFVELTYNNTSPLPPFIYTTEVRVLPQPTRLTLHVLNGAVEPNSADAAWGSVSCSPRALNDAQPKFQHNTPVTLTAVPYSERSFSKWLVYDPCYPGDANYAIDDANAMTSVVMDVPREVSAVFGTTTGTLAVDTTPVKGEVFVNQQSWGQAPQSQIVSVGEHRVSFGSVEGYVTPIDANAVVHKDGTTSVTGTYVPVLVVGILAEPNAILPGHSSKLTAQPTGGTPPYNYLWSDANQTTTFIDVAPSATTAYEVTVTDSGTPTPQKTTAKVTISVPTKVVVNAMAEPPVVASGAACNLTASPSGGEAPYSYLWSSGQTGPNVVVSPLQTTNYTVTVTDAVGQTDDANVVVTVAQGVGVSLVAEPNIVRVGGTSRLKATASGGYGSYSYQWGADPNQNAAEILVKPTQATSYTVKVTDTLGQFAEAGVSVDVAPGLGVEVTANPNWVIAGETITLTARVIGGREPYAHRWNTGQTGSTINVTPSKTDTYTVTITDSLTQSVSASVSVTVGTGVTASAVARPTIVYSGGSAVLSASAMGGIPPYSFAWETGQTDANITVNPFESTTYRVTATDAKGHVSSPASVTVTVAGAPTVSCEAYPSSLVVGQSATLVAVINGGLPPYRYRWVNPNDPNDPNGPATTSMTVKPKVTTTYGIKVTDSLGQPAEGSITISVVSPLSIRVAASPNEIDPGQTSEIVATATGGIGPYQYSWSPVAGTEPNIVVSPAADTTYAVVIIDSSGRTVQGTTSVRVRPQYNLTVVVAMGQGTVSPTAGTYRQGTTVSLQATASEGYQFVGWSGDLDGSGPITNPLTVVMNSNKAFSAMFTPLQAGPNEPQYPANFLPGCGGTVGTSHLAAGWAMCLLGLGGFRALLRSRRRS